MTIVQKKISAYYVIAGFVSLSFPTCQNFLNSGEVGRTRTEKEERRNIFWI